MTRNLLYQLKERMKKGEIRVARIKGTSHLLILDIKNEEWAEIDCNSLVEIEDIRKDLWEMSDIEFDKF
jgi:diaminopimelate decarboxylase